MAYLGVGAQTVTLHWPAKHNRVANRAGKEVAGGMPALPYQNKMLSLLVTEPAGQPSGAPVRFGAEVPLLRHLPTPFSLRLRDRLHPSHAIRELDPIVAEADRNSENWIALFCPNQSNQFRLQWVETKELTRDKIARR